MKKNSCVYDAETHSPGKAKSTQASYAAVFLDKLGLAQYTAAFEKSGFENHRAIHKLCQQDLDDIERFSGSKILPGHRKVLVNAATSLQVPVPAQSIIPWSVDIWASSLELAVYSQMSPS